MRERYIGSRISKIIIALSKASFGIYLIHQIIIWSLNSSLKPLGIWLYNINTNLVGLVIGLIFFGISFFFVYLMQKIPIVKKMVP
jgi:surface polysaccharide O-acyltransferase-like enzyme